MIPHPIRTIDETGDSSTTVRNRITFVALNRPLALLTFLPYHVSTTSISPLNVAAYQIQAQADDRNFESYHVML